MPLTHSQPGEYANSRFDNLSKRFEHWCTQYLHEDTCWNKTLSPSHIPADPSDCGCSNDIKKKSKAFFNLMSWLFHTADTLYYFLAEEPLKYPEKWGPDDDQPNTSWTLFSYSTLLPLYCLLALVDSLRVTAEKLCEIGPLHNLEIDVKELRQQLQQYENVRNFFAHIDERLYDEDRLSTNGRRVNLHFQGNSLKYINIDGNFASNRNQLPREFTIDLSKPAVGKLFPPLNRIYQTILACNCLFCKALPQSNTDDTSPIYRAFLD